MTTNPLLIIGILIFFVGMFIFLVGKKCFFLRWFFNDRSMFWQLFYGLILVIIGLFFLYFSGALS
ncbi:hypothetical protein FVP43_00275 [Lactococcus sp. dk322]|nr:hypothetical protein FVP42_00275 [Lactococcus sp. dk310]TXK51852.1 hypothetical protein FVP43_00275 [Lactococcus sp. dk322]